MQKNQLINLPKAETRVCDCCGGQAVRASFETQKFNYGTERDLVELVARVPVWKCQICGDQYTDHVAEELRHAAVCRHLGRLTPDEVLDLRNSWGMTQAEWADLTGFGIASVKRWESGNLIQGASADNLMRLLQDSANVEKLRRLRAKGKKEERVSKFRTEFSTETAMLATVFELRRPVRAAGNA